MSLSDIKALNQKQAATLEFHHWTIEKLAVATIKELTGYTGIGKITAKKTITEAAEILNEQGLEDADRLALEYYYQKAAPAKILKDWEDEGLAIEVVALTSARALVKLKSIDDSLALLIISEAQKMMNKRGLYESRVTTSSGGGHRVSSPAFDEKWLSGEKEPPAMSIRVRRNFEREQVKYRATRG